MTSSLTSSMISGVIGEHVPSARMISPSAHTLGGGLGGGVVGGGVVFGSGSGSSAVLTSLAGGGDGAGGGGGNVGNVTNVGQAGGAGGGFSKTGSGHTQ